VAESIQREERRSWGQRVEARRLELQLSQGQLGRISQVPQQTISRIELDRVAPRYETMDKIARGLGTTVEDLFPQGSHPRHLRVSRKVGVAARRAG
jgi:transcriptional regulator with XRE-family HTH domain